MSWISANFSEVRLDKKKIIALKSAGLGLDFSTSNIINIDSRPVSTILVIMAGVMAKYPRHFRQVMIISSETWFSLGLCDEEVPKTTSFEEKSAIISEDLGG